MKPQKESQESLLLKCKDLQNLIYKTYWISWDILDWEFFDYHTLRLWDFIAELELRKISKLRYKNWNSWTDELLFLWEFPRKEFEYSCSTIEWFISLCNFLLQVKDYETYMFPSDSFTHNDVK